MLTQLSKNEYVAIDCWCFFFFMYFDKLLSLKVVPIYFSTSFLLDIPFPQVLPDTIIIS